jgi:hypothetical protein
MLLSFLILTHFIRAAFIFVFGNELFFYYLFVCLYTSI